MGKKAANLYAEIGAAIQRQRTSANPSISQKQLADAIGLSRASVVNIERGRHRIQIHVLYDIATVLGIDAVMLLPPGDSGATAEALPSEFKERLNPNELAAVGQLLKSSRGTTNEEA